MLELKVLDEMVLEELAPIIAPPRAAWLALKVLDEMMLLVALRNRAPPEAVATLELKVLLLIPVVAVKA